VIAFKEGKIASREEKRKSIAKARKRKCIFERRIKACNSLELSQAYFYSPVRLSTDYRSNRKQKKPDQCPEKKKDCKGG